MSLHFSEEDKILGLFYFCLVAELLFFKPWHWASWLLYTLPLVPHFPFKSTYYTELKLSSVGHRKAMEKWMEKHRHSLKCVISPCEWSEQNSPNMEKTLGQGCFPTPALPFIFFSWDKAIIRKINSACHWPQVTFNLGFVDACEPKTAPIQLQKVNKNNFIHRA